MKSYNRVIILILDSVGCGVQPDYKKFGHKKCNTLASVYKSKSNFSLPNLEKIGLKKLIFNKATPLGISGQMRQLSTGNDTFAGISEMLGIIFKKRFRSVKKGFSKQTIAQIKETLHVSIVGNEYISGFKALGKYFYLHKKHKVPILYLADDGVILLAAHEKIISPKKLNKWGELLAKTLKNKGISRVITRPFIGKKGNFIRTKNRRDFLSTPFYSKSILPELTKNNVKILLTEHIFNLFARPAKADFLPGNYSNISLINLIIKTLKHKNNKQLLLFCLQDFDLYGHKKDVNGYRKKLAELDKNLPRILTCLDKKDLLIITADHGCDPTLNVRGHTREFVPLLIFSKKLKQTHWLGTRGSYSDIAQTICYNFKIKKCKEGKIINEIF